jgi:hypothetical protein
MPHTCTTKPACKPRRRSNCFHGGSFPYKQTPGDGVKFSAGPLAKPRVCAPSMIDFFSEDIHDWFNMHEIDPSKRTNCQSGNQIVHIFNLISSFLKGCMDGRYHIIVGTILWRNICMIVYWLGHWNIWYMYNAWWLTTIRCGLRDQLSQTECYIHGQRYTFHPCKCWRKCRV